MLHRKLAIKLCCIFPIHASTLLCETGNTETASFHLNAAHMLFCEQIYKTIKSITYSQT